MGRRGVGGKPPERGFQQLGGAFIAFQQDGFQLGPYQAHAGNAPLAVFFQHAVHQVGQSGGYLGAALLQIGRRQGQDGGELGGDGIARERQAARQHFV